MVFYQVTDKRTGEIKVLEAAQGDKHGLETVIEQSGLGRVDARDWRGKTRNIVDKHELIVAIAEANSLVLDMELKWSFEYLEPSALPDDTHQFIYEKRNGNSVYNGKSFYYIIRSRDKDTDGVLYPYKRPEIITVTPQKLWRAVGDLVDQLVKNIHSLDKGTMEKLLIGLLVGIALGEIFILYLFVQG
jgi:hypothetical protein